MSLHLRRFSLLTWLLMATLLLVVGSVSASAVEPVDDSAYDARLLDMLRLVTPTSADNQALNEIGSSNSRDIFTRLLVVRAQAKLEPGFGWTQAWPAQSSVKTWQTDSQMPGGQLFLTLRLEMQGVESQYSVYRWGRRMVGDAVCAGYINQQVAVDSWVLEWKPVGGSWAQRNCAMNKTAWQPADPEWEATFAAVSSLATIESSTGCTKRVLGYPQWQVDGCIAATMTEDEMLKRVRIEPTRYFQVGDVPDHYTPFGSQTWNYPAPDPTPTSILASARQSLSDSKNQTLRAVLNHILDPDNYPLPVPSERAWGSTCPSSGDPPVCLQNTTGDPVNTATGLLNETAVDLDIPAPGVRFQFSRTYFGLGAPGEGSDISGIFWVNSLMPRAEERFIETRVMFEGGSRVDFVQGLDGTFRAPAGVRARLTRAGNGDLVVTTSDRIRLQFDDRGRLISKTDAAGQGISITWRSCGWPRTGCIASVTDAAGRQYNFSYDAPDKLLKRITLSDGRYVEYTYDAQTRLTAVRNTAGEVTQYGYAQGALSSITNPLGQVTVQTTYDGTGRVQSQTDARGGTWTYSWDPGTQTAVTTDPRGGTHADRYKGNVLVSQTDPLGNSVSYSYDRWLNRTRMVDARGGITRGTYNATGQITSLMDPSGNTTGFTYNTAGDLTSKTDRRGKTTTYVSDVAGRATSVTDPATGVTSMTYNAKGQLASITDARGKTSTFTFDAAGNRASVTDPTGRKETMTYDAFGRLATKVEARGNVVGANPVDYQTVYTYDGADRLKTVTDPLGRLTTYTYDVAGRRIGVTDPTNAQTTFAYNTAGDLTGVTDPAGNATTFEYDLGGNLTKRTDRTGALTTYTYDLAGNRTSVTTPRGNVSGALPALYTTTFSYDPEGNLTQVTPPVGGATGFSYDLTDRLTVTTDAAAKTVTTAYDAEGNPTSVTDQLGKTTSTTYDNLGRPTSVTDANNKVTALEYDPTGNVTKVTAPAGGITTYTYDDAGRRATMVEPRGNQAGGVPADYRTSYAYDAAGNLTGITNPLGQTTTFGFDRAGRQASATDANNRTTTYGYDPVDRLSSVTAPTGAVTGYGYDTRGRLTTRTNANNRVTTYGYDNEGRLTSLSNPLGRIQSFGYDKDGNLTTKITARGNAAANPATGMITTTRDALGRPTGIDYGDTTPDVGFTYDPRGRMTQTTDGAGTTTYTYDDAGRVTGVTQPAGAGGGSFAYAYDPVGNITSRTYPDATVIGATYNPDNRIATLTRGTSTISFGYDTAGRQTTMTLPTGNGYIESRTYDRAGRLTEVKNQKASTILSRFTATLDPVGNPTLIATTRGTTTTNEAFTYDALNQLTKDCIGVTTCTGATNTVSWAYDPVGNRTGQTRAGGTTPPTTTYTYDAADQLTSTTSGSTNTNYAYDADGNQTGIGTSTRSFDLANRMTGHTQGTTTTTYAYDGMGRRVSRATNGTVNTRYSWDQLHGLPQLALERNNAGTLINRYTNAPDRAVAMQTSAGEFFPHADLTGSITDVTSSTGAAQWRWTYEAFGAQRTETKIVTSAPSVPTRFNGQYLDTESGLYHLRARQYDPAVGRFTATDPVAPSISDPYVATHVYATNQPLTKFDPSGEDWRISIGGHGITILPDAVTDVAGGWVGDHARAAIEFVSPGCTTTLADRYGGDVAGNLVFVPLACLDAANPMRDVPEGAQMIFTPGCAAKGARTVSLGVGQTALDTIVGKYGGRLLSKGLGRLAERLGLRGGRGSLAAKAADEIVGGVGYRSFSAFKRAMGPAGPDMQWHHVVEQTGGNVSRFGSEAIHNTDNLVALETSVHRKISGYYSSKQAFTGGQTVRQWLSTQSYEAQQRFGQRIMDRFSP